METKAYLAQVSRFDRMIDNKLKEIWNLRQILCGTSSAMGDGERIQTTKEPDKICSYVSRIVDMEQEVDNIIDRRVEIVRQIESMPDTNMYDVLFQRYILGKDIKAIQLKDKVSLKQVKRTYYNALGEFENQYGYLYLQKGQNVP